MTVEQFDPQKPSKSATKPSDSIAKQTTTLKTPVKVIEEQSNAQQDSNRAAKVGFVSLGCPKVY
ncbi:hypothetical protein [Thalassotalea hakodatensis]|uniref:hypothetical protein n=1 Tax=Thalassotalea hakodatensis TaxID=3030492 RepID=UPI0025737309|nr:hypothetical protein [Thalassotalea hakodatensis]